MVLLSPKINSFSAAVAVPKASDKTLPALSPVMPASFSLVLTCCIAWLLVILPFCTLANSLSVNSAPKASVKAAFASPELVTIFLPNSVTSSKPRSDRIPLCVASFEKPINSSIDKPAMRAASAEPLSASKKPSAPPAPVSKPCSTLLKAVAKSTPKFLLNAWVVLSTSLASLPKVLDTASTSTTIPLRAKPDAPDALPASPSSFWNFLLSSSSADIALKARPPAAKMPKAAMPATPNLAAASEPCKKSPAMPVIAPAPPNLPTLRTSRPLMPFPPCGVLSVFLSPNCLFRSVRAFWLIFIWSSTWASSLTVLAVSTPLSPFSKVAYKDLLLACKFSVSNCSLSMSLSSASSLAARRKALTTLSE